jgi:hypothetical protein
MWQTVAICDVVNGSYKTKSIELRVRLRELGVEGQVLSRLMYYAACPDASFALPPGRPVILQSNYLAARCGLADIPKLYNPLPSGIYAATPLDGLSFPLRMAMKEQERRSSSQVTSKS